MKKLAVRDLGRMPYGEALEIQDQANRSRYDEEIPDTLFFVEHPPVITLGRSTSEDDILISSEERSRLGVEVHRISRGGLATYHGPGQLVGYPIVHLYEQAVHIKRFITALERMFVDMLGELYNVDAHLDAENRGVWVGSRKITAVGIAVRNRVTMHGFAFNVTTDLSHFDWIIPCGIRDRGVTSLEECTGRTVNLADVRAQVTRAFRGTFGYTD
ncbi:MAG: lipoyl(octanoyl) transferase LipB [Spirochaetaceae bacterium]|nr:MAG: lipoyl(octanoyl) transferase LipB [Spirochaetaceae bacterium]